jgi:hypothetical protein
LYPCCANNLAVALINRLRVDNFVLTICEEDEITVQQLKRLFEKIQTNTNYFIIMVMEWQGG